MEKLPHSLLEPLVFRDGRGLPCRIIPGPMEGISEGSFVAVMSEMGMVRCWFTPFIRVSNGVPRMARLREKLAPYLATGLPVIAQIMGTVGQAAEENGPLRADVLAVYSPVRGAGTTAASVLLGMILAEKEPTVLLCTERYSVLPALLPREPGRRRTDEGCVRKNGPFCTQP